MCGSLPGRSSIRSYKADKVRKKDLEKLLQMGRYTATAKNDQHCCFIFVQNYLFRNAPVVLFITSDWPLGTGLAAQNIETMAVALGMGALYNGFLARIADKNVTIMYSR